MVKSKVDNSFRIILFFTRGMSLQVWDSIGMFEREVALYRRLQSRGVEVSFVTYGDKNELKYRERLAGISILCNRWNLSPQQYESWLPLLHGWHLWRASLYKTNQTNGAGIALRAAQIWHKPFIARQGYLFSLHSEKTQGKDSSQVKEAVRLEKEVLPLAQRVVVTAPFMKDYIFEHYDISPKRMVIIPNYVDADLFKPDSSISRQTRNLFFLGRFEEQKNTINLIEAIHGLDIELSMVGSGSLESQIRELVKKYHLKVNIIGNVPNHLLPNFYNRAGLYIQPSLFEGHPKSIIEAMACGSPVIGGNTLGSREVIRHGVTGWLCEPTVEGIRTAIQTLLADEPLRRKLGENARAYVLQHCSLERVAEMELALYREVVRNGY